MASQSEFSQDLKLHEAQNSLRILRVYTGGVNQGSGFKVLAHNTFAGLNVIIITAIHLVFTSYPGR
jgi:hypothetical protein